MKKVVLGVAALSFLALVSCKKDYTCECTSTGSGFSGSSSVTINDTKKNAEEACEASASSASAGGSSVTTTCELKD